MMVGRACIPPDLCHLLHRNFISLYLTMMVALVPRGLFLTFSSSRQDVFLPVAQTHDYVFNISLFLHNLLCFDPGDIGILK